MDCKAPCAMAWKVLSIGANRPSDGTRGQCSGLGIAVCLRPGANDFIAVGDEVVPFCVQFLAGLDPPLHAGKSAVAGLAAVTAALAQPKLGKAIGIRPDSRVLVVICEGGHISATA